MASQIHESDSDQSTKTPQVSIGMPVYNGEPFIREALDSLLAQTFTDFELIISDNASTDGTEAVCREYAAKDDRIRYVRQEENRGAAANFQFVLEQARFPFFMFASHDDLWDPIHIIVCIGKLQENPHLVGCSPKSIYDNRTDSRITGDSGVACRSCGGRLIEITKNMAANCRFYGIYRTSVLKQIDLRNYDFYAGDWAWILTVATHGCIGHVESQASFFKRRGPSHDVKRYLDTSFSSWFGKAFALRSFWWSATKDWGFEPGFTIWALLISLKRSVK